MADDAIAVLEQAREAGLTVRLDGSDLQVDGEGELTPEALAAVKKLKKHKAEVVSLLGKYGDGNPPPLDRPIANEQELRRWMDWTTDPGKFAKWIEWAMNRPDLSER